MLTKSTQKGTRGEEEASTYLTSLGYRIIERNWRKPPYEIDIIALEDNTLVFVEVKTQFMDTDMTPEEEMSSYKIRALKRGALVYANAHPEFPESLRIDFVGVRFNKSDSASFNLIKNITL